MFTEVTVHRVPVRGTLQTGDLFTLDLFPDDTFIYVNGETWSCVLGALEYQSSLDYEYPLWAWRPEHTGWLSAQVTGQAAHWGAVDDSEPHTRVRGCWQAKVTADGDTEYVWDIGEVAA